MNDTPHNQFHILAERLKNCRERQKELDIEYEGKRKGSNYSRAMGLLTREEAGILSRSQKIGATCNIIRVIGWQKVTSFQISSGALTPVSQESVEVFYTGITVEDAKLLTMEIFPHLTIFSAEEIMPKRARKKS
jgi:hypothetical protein